MSDKNKKRLTRIIAIVLAVITLLSIVFSAIMTTPTYIEDHSDHNHLEYEIVE